MGTMPEVTQGWSWALQWKNKMANKNSIHRKIVQRLLANENGITRKTPRKITIEKFKLNGGRGQDLRSGSELI